MNLCAKNFFISFLAGSVHQLHKILKKSHKMHSGHRSRKTVLENEPNYSIKLKLSSYFPIIFYCFNELFSLSVLLCILLLFFRWYKKFFFSNILFIFCIIMTIKLYDCLVLQRKKLVFAATERFLVDFSWEEAVPNRSGNFDWELTWIHLIIA